MTKFTRTAIVIVIILIVGVVIAYKEIGAKREKGSKPIDINVNVLSDQQNDEEAAIEKTALPKLIDLGADRCIPCKMMAPILEELSKEYCDIFSVEFIDVWKNKSEANKYGIEIIPTQIFFDAEGKELFRHQGFFSKEDILAKWKQFGVNVERKAN